MRAGSWGVALAIAMGAFSTGSAQATTVDLTGGVLTITGGPTTNAATYSTFRETGPDRDAVQTVGDPITTAVEPANCDFLGGTKVTCLDAAVDSIVINGGNGVDTITLGNEATHETANGGVGNDVLTTTQADNVDDDLLGDAGDDTINSTRGIAQGGADNDTIKIFGAANNAYVTGSGGAGNDMMFSMAPAGREYGVQLDGGDGDDVLTGNDGPENLYGDAGSDVITGAGGDDQLAAGDESFPAVAANDTLNGGAGNDSLSPGRGNDTVSGGAGYDFLAAFVAEAANNAFPMSISLDGAANDGIAGSAGNYAADLELLLVGDDNDTVVGGPGAERIIGLGGSDTLSGGGGPDVISADGDSDLGYAAGVDGNDTIDARDGNGDLVRCGGGNDSLTGDDLDDHADCETTSLATVSAPPAPPPIVPPPVIQQVGAPGDSTRPLLRFGAAAQRTFKGWKTTDVAGKGVTYPVSTNEPASIVCEVLATPRGSTLRKVGDVVIGEAKLARGTGARSCRISINRKFRKQAAKLKRLRIRVAATDAAGNRTESTGTVALTKPAKKK